MGRTRRAPVLREGHNDWDPPIEPYDPYGPGAQVTRDVGDEDIDD